MFRCLPAAVLLLACSAPQPRRVPPKPLPEPLPPAPAGTIWADGHGQSARQAELDARRAVSEQIVSTVRSRSSATEAEQNGEGDRYAQVRTDVATAFDRAELIKTLKVVKRGDGFVARAALDKDEAAKVYREAFEDGRAAIARVVPVLAESMATLDTSVLLSADHSPAILAGRLSGLTRVLRAVDRPIKRTATAAELSIASQAAQLRQRAVIRLVVKGEVSPALRRGVIGALEEALRSRGCRFVPAAHGPPVEGQPTANATLSLAVRDHVERGLHWRYLGLDLSIDDARSGRSVLRFTGMPRLVHGGGGTPVQAEQAVVRRLRDVLPEKAGQALAGLTCR